MATLLGCFACYECYHAIRVDKVHEVTRLEWFIRTHGLKPAWVAREAEISRQHLLRLRKGLAEPSRKVMVLLRRGCSRLLHRRVALRDLFEVEKR